LHVDSVSQKKLRVVWLLQGTSFVPEKVSFGK